MSRLIGLILLTVIIVSIILAGIWWWPELMHFIDTLPETISSWSTTAKASGVVGALLVLVIIFALASDS